MISVWLFAAFSYAGETDGVKGSVDAVAVGQLNNLLERCHVVGTFTEWQHAGPLSLLDVTGQNLGEISAGILQFGPNSWLEGCSLMQFRAPSNNSIDFTAQTTPPRSGSGYNGGIYLEGVLVNYIIADGHHLDDGIFDRLEAGRSAHALLQGYYQLAESTGNQLPLVEEIRTSALGSASFQFGILLIKNSDGSFDVAIRRETLATKFAPGLTQEQQAETAVTWSSIK